MAELDSPSAALAEPEYTMSAADFERVRQLIYQRAGISLHAGKQAMVYSRLSRRLRETGHRSFADYLAWLQQARDAAARATEQSAGFLRGMASCVLATHEDAAALVALGLIERTEEGALRCPYEDIHVDMHLAAAA